MPIKKLISKKGFTLAELMIVVAIIGILLGVGAAFINPNEFTYVEANRNAESIATAAQNRLTELRNTGGIDSLQGLGVTYVSSGKTKGGYRYIFSHDGDGKKNSQMAFILPFGTIDQELNDGYYAIGIQTDTGMVGEVFFSKDPFEQFTADYLIAIASDESTRKSKIIGYYHGAVDDMQIAFAQLPTPQLTITNYENLSLDIYLPKVKELVDQGKNMAIRVSLVDAEDKALNEGGLTLDDTAIYRTYEYNNDGFSQTFNGLSMGNTYTMILDTPDNTLSDTTILGELANVGFTSEVKGKFEAWANKTKAYTDKEKYLKLGDNAKIYVTVFAIDTEGTIDPTFMPRSASVTFCSWFETFDGETATIACGRHLQNLGKLTKINSNQTANLPTCEVKDGTYKYDNFSRGKAYLYTNNGSGISEKYAYRDDVAEVEQAEQVKAIDFDCEEWYRSGEPIPFTPINLPGGFKYYGNYLTIKHLYVDAPFYAGLFGYAYNYSLYDILLVNPHVVSHVPLAIAEAYEMGVGALIGTSRDSSEINNCQVYMEPETYNDATGKKITGYNSDKYRIEGECYVGGLIGFCEDEHIRQNSASVYVGYREDNKEAKTSKYVGGLIGCISGDVSVKRSYGAGNLTGDYVGGLIGCVMEDSYSSGDRYLVEGCYSAGHIESANVSAAGLIGLIHEQGGYTKSALSAKGNYCAVIYGVSHDEGVSYKWESEKKASGGTASTAAEEDNNMVPIYGTFEGDGFEWLYASESGKITGSYKDPDDPNKSLFGGFDMFFGADFATDNQNYYIPQKDITYSHSDYFDSIKGLALEALEILESANPQNPTEIIAELDKIQEKIKKEKLLETLDEIDYEMQSMIEALEAEKKFNSSGTDYTANTTTDNKKTLVLATNHAEFTDHPDSNDTILTLDVLAGLKAVYNGEGIDDKKITYENGGTESYKYVKGNSEELINYTFEGLADLIRKAIEENDDEQLYRLLGTDSNWTNGLVYKRFYYELLRALFSESKDYYDSIGDEVGKQMFYYYRDILVEKKIGYYFNTMACTTEDLEKQLQDIKEHKLDKAVEHVQTVIDYAEEYWDEDAFFDEDGKITHYGMKTAKEQAKELAETAKAALNALIDVFDGVNLPTPTTSPEEMQAAIKTAYEAYNALYEYFDEGKVDITVTVNGEEKKVSKSIKDLYGETLKVEKDKYGYDAVDAYNCEIYDEDTTCNNDMRGIRDALKDVRDYINLIGTELNSGVEGAIERLEYLLKLDGTNTNNQSAIDECKKSINSYLGTEWGSTDSGHRIYDATELRQLRDTDDENGNPYIDRDFRYDYGRTEGYQDKADGSGEAYKKYSYMDQDNGIYNNVFPYRENDYTAYYPFLMIRGMAVDGGSIATGVLFHYGDWLTQDLWLTYSVTYHTKYSNEVPEFSGDDITLETDGIPESAISTFDPSIHDDIIKSRDEDLDTPYYFGGWYLDNEYKTPYTYDQIKDKVEGSHPPYNFDLYAKWETKPSLTFYAADLKGDYRGREVTVDTSLMIKSGSQLKTSDNKNSYEHFTVYLKPEQEAEFSVSGHYKYSIYEETGPVLNDSTYIIDSITIVKPEVTNPMSIIPQNAIDRDKGMAKFSVPTNSDYTEYEITLSEAKEGGGSGFEFNICLAEGTMIRMADGSQKAVEDLEVGDMALTFNHIIGKYEATTVWMTPHKDAENKLYTVTNLKFSDGSLLKVVGEHGLFDRSLNKYVFINKNNYHDYIGHEFSAVTLDGNKFEDIKIILTDVSVSSELTRIYSPITENHLNIVAENKLTVTSMMGYGDAVMNLFDYKSDMSYDLASMASDILKYGVYSYSDFADLLPYEVYSKVPLGIMKVAVGKGLISYEEIRQIIQFIYDNGYLS